MLTFITHIAVDPTPDFKTGIEKPAGRPFGGDCRSHTF
jgi:hypothetical protein